MAHARALSARGVHLSRAAEAHACSHAGRCHWVLLAAVHVEGANPLRLRQAQALGGLRVRGHGALRRPNDRVGEEVDVADLLDLLVAGDFRRSALLEALQRPDR